MSPEDRCRHALLEAGFNQDFIDRLGFKTKLEALVEMIIIQGIHPKEAHRLWDLKKNVKRKNLEGDDVNFNDQMKKALENVSVENKKAANTSYPFKKGREEAPKPEDFKAKETHLPSGNKQSEDWELLWSKDTPAGYNERKYPPAHLRKP